MKENLSDRLDSIFEIKIKEDKICSAFRTLQQRMHVLQHNLNKVQLKQQQSPFGTDEEKAKKYIEKLIFQSIRPINEKLLEHQHALNNTKYNHENLCHNMAEQFKLTVKQFQSDINETKARMMTEECKIKQDVEVHKIKIDQNQLLFNQFLSQNSRKDRDFQVKIENIWDVIRSIRKNIDDIDLKPPKKSIAIKHSQFRQMKQNEGDHHFKSKTAMKKHVSRESILKNNFSHEKSIEYASLLAKIQTLETKFKELTANNEKQSQRVLTSKRRIGTDNDLEGFGTNEDLGRTIIENRKKFRSPHQSRFGRSSIRTQEPQPQLQANDDKERKKMEADIKKLNEKYSQITYKFTLLQENYEIILRKLPRINQIELSVQAKAEEIEKLRVDLSTINEIKMRYRKIESTFQEQEENYVAKSTYTKQYDSVKETIRDIQAFSMKLAKQDEIKQAFEFIQNKIKQIVLILTDKFEVDRQGAINKVNQIKCLTCDKEVEHNSFHHKFNNTTSSQVLSRGKKYRNTRTTFKRVHTEEC